MGRDTSDAAAHGPAPILLITKGRDTAMTIDPETGTVSSVFYYDASELKDHTPALIAALIAARKEIKMWHSLHSSEEMERQDWIDYQETAVMQQINAAIAKATQP